MLLLLAFACAPSAPSSLLRTDAEPPGDHCAAGGTAVASGLDDDGDGTLGDDEVDHTVYVCNGEPGNEGSSGEDGSDSLIAVSDEPAGANCAYGGERVDSGVDDDGDGTLDPEEIDATAYVCDGAPGGTSLVRVTAEPKGANCPYGGQRVESGVDVDGDGVLSDDEIATTSYVCNGDAGEPGAGALVDAVDEPAGANCADGGVAVRVGTDDDGDGALSETEVDTTFYVCDGADGASGGIAGTVIVGDYEVINSLDIALLAGVEQITGTLTIDGSTLGTVDLPDLREVDRLVLGDTSGVTMILDGLSLPALTTLDTGLQVWNTEIPDWSGLDAVTTVGSYVELYGASGVSTLAALPNLTSVGTLISLSISSEAGVTEIAGFDALTSTPAMIWILYTGTVTGSTRVTAFPTLTSVGRLRFDSDAHLTDVSGFSNLQEVTGSLEMGTIGIADFTQFASLTTLGSLSLEDTDHLTSLAGLESVAALPDGLTIRGCDGLTHLAGLDNVTSAGSVSISGDDALVDFTGLDALTTVDGRLTLQDLPVASLTGLDALTSVDELVVEGNDALTDLTALSSLTGTVSELAIAENPVLTNLDGLEAITHVGYPSSAEAGSYSLVLSGNDALSDVTGLYGLTAVDYGIVHVDTNPARCTTAVTALRAHLGTDTGTWFVSGNKGC